MMTRSFGRQGASKVDQRAERLAQKLRRALPLAAHGLTALAAALRRRFSGANVLTRLTVTDVFYASEEKGLMCRIDLHGKSGPPILLVAPLTQLAFNRRHAIAQEIAAYRKRRAEKAAVNRREV